MVILALAWIYISFVCIAWGNLTLKLINGILGLAQGRTFPDLALICLLGLSAIGCLAFYFSIFFPLSWGFHLFVAVIAILYFLSPANRTELKPRLIAQVGSFSRTGLIFLLSCVLLVLIINSYYVTHPDTLAYHAQSIRWMETYRSIPGLVHLQRELGFQSLWFAVQAVFRFPFASSPMIFFLGGAVMSWFILFMTKKMGSILVKTEFAQQGIKTNWFAFFLLCFAFISWTQIRLSAASASPDFITTILILASIYVLQTAGNSQADRPFYLILASVFCATAICVKLSAAVVALFPLWFIIEAAWKRKVRVALICLAACCVIIFPLLIRNYFASGWLLYPSSFPDLVHAEWKFDANDLDRFQHYITAYARFPVEEPATDQVLAMPLNQWTAIWWKNLTWADQALIILLGIAVAFDIIFLRQLARIVKKDLILCITILTIGVLVWFLKAPDPRFGSGFIQGLLYCLLIPWKEKGEGILKHGRRWIFSFLVFAFLASVLSYSIYRVSRYFDPKEIILPLGIKETKYRMIHCGNLEINLVNADSTECGSTTVPCSKDSCANFSPRGNGIEDGFRQRK